MLLLLSSFVASLDGLVLGFGLKSLKIKLSFSNIITLFFSNFFIYFIVLFLYTFFQLQFVTKPVSTFFYLLLALFAWKNKDDVDGENVSIELGFFPCIMLSFTHSLDGTLISLGFVYQYSFLLIAILFSFMAVLLFVFGYLLAHKMEFIKKSNHFSGLLFLFLAILNQFF